MAYLTVRRFRHFLEGRPFTIFTDYKAQTSAFKSSRTNYSPQEVHHLAEFSTDAQHVSGSTNIPADILCRLCTLSSSAFSLDRLANLQEDDQKLQVFRSSSTQLKLKDIYFPDHITITCDIPTGKDTPFVPFDTRRQVLNSFHSLAHPGIKASHRLVTELYSWPGMNADRRL